jgi:drug/metabolite transporter (DMT)-like permease
MAVPDSGPGQGELLAFGAAVAFSMKAIFVKLAFAVGADPIALLAVRMVIALPIFLVIAWKTAPGWPSRRDAGALLALGLLGYHAAAALDFAGLRYVSAGLERVVLYVHPTLVVLFAAALQGRKPGLKELAGIAIAWSGLALAVGGDIRFGETGDVAKGVGLVLGCAVAYAGYLLGAESLGRRLGAVHTASVATATSALTLSLQVALTQPGDVLSLSREAVGYAAVLALVSTVLPVLLLAAAILKVGPARASTIGMIGPTLAAILGWAILGEPLTWLHLAGGIVVAVGVALARRT